MFEVGISAKVITPEIGTRFGGFALERQSPVTGVHDDLYASAFVVSNDEDSLIIVSCDLQTISPELVDKIRTQLFREFGVPPSNILIAATHVHSAPGGDFSEKQIPGVDPFYTDSDTCQRVEDGICNAVRGAFANQVKSTILSGEQQIEGIGRSRHSPDCHDSLPAQLLIARELTNGHEIAAIAAYGCHPSVLGPDNTKISADYPGVLRRELQAHLNGAPVMFLNTASGDISTRAIRGEQTIAEVDRLGRELSQQVWHINEFLEPVEGNQIRGASKVLQIPIRTDLLKSLKDSLEQVKVSSLRHQKLALSIERLSAIENQCVPCEVQALRCGDIAFIGVAAELFFGVALEIATESPARLTMVVAPANGTIGNVPGEDLHSTVAPIVHHCAPNQIRSAARSLMAQLFADTS